MDKRGRITIPKEKREKLGLKPGEKLSVIEKDGQLIIRKKFSPNAFIKHLKGCITDETNQIDPLEIKKIWVEKH